MFESISFDFLLESLIGIVAGILVIRFRIEIATFLGGHAGTNTIRDLDRPYVYTVLGILMIISSVVMLGIALLS